jgi:hypothetical protein
LLFDSGDGANIHDACLEREIDGAPLIAADGLGLALKA